MPLCLLFVTLILVQNAFASEISIKFHEEADVHFDINQFKMRSQPVNTKTLSAAQSEVDMVNDLLSRVPIPPSDGNAIVRQPFNWAPKEVLDKWRQNAEEYWGEPMEDLATFYSISVADEEKQLIGEFRRLEVLSIVETVEFIPEAIPSQTSGPTPDFESFQGYLNNDNNGVHARAA